MAVSDFEIRYDNVIESTPVRREMNRQVEFRPQREAKITAGCDAIFPLW